MYYRNKDLKRIFGFSDNTHFANFLWENGIPSYYGGSLFVQFARGKHMDELTVKYLKLIVDRNKYNPHE